MSDQLIFDLPCYPAIGTEDFFVSKANSLAFEVIQNWTDWNDRRVLITGGKGSGKTHLTHVWANLSGAEFIDLNNPERDFSEKKPIIIEDIDLIISIPTFEEKLFHLLNFAKQLDIYVLMTSSVAASRLGVQLLDLSSRLQATAHFPIYPPDDALLSAVLVKQFSDRQINISPSLIEYILKRITRSLLSVSDFVDSLDNLMLKTKKGPSRAMISEILDKFIKNEA